MDGGNSSGGLQLNPPSPSLSPAVGGRREGPCRRRTEVSYAVWGWEGEGGR